MGSKSNTTGVLIGRGGSDPETPMHREEGMEDGGGVGAGPLQETPIICGVSVAIHPVGA